MINTLRTIYMALLVIYVLVAAVSITLRVREDKRHHKAMMQIFGGEAGGHADE